MQKLRTAVLLLLFTVFCFSACQFGYGMWQKKQDQQAFAQLRQQLQEVEPEPVQPSQEPIQQQQPTAEEVEQQQRLAGYQALQAVNDDMVGWLRIPDTQLDYPVMWSSQKEYYLRRNFEKKYSISGTPFLADNCTVDSENVLIYGHNMTDGSMFGSLSSYRDEAYWKEHPIIYFDTPTELREYQVLAVFQARVLRQDEEGFRYYEYGGTLDEQSYMQYMQQVKQEALYDTGIEAQYGEQLLTLSTCSYHTQQGRFVVVAKRIS